MLTANRSARIHFCESTKKSARARKTSEPEQKSTRRTHMHANPPFNSTRVEFQFANTEKVLFETTFMPSNTNRREWRATQKRPPCLVHLSLWPRCLCLAAHGTGFDFDCFSLACCWAHSLGSSDRDLKRVSLAQYGVRVRLFAHSISIAGWTWSAVPIVPGCAGNWSNICFSKLMAVFGGHAIAIPTVHTFADCPSRNGLPLNGA